jgi:hypothetical protein
MTAFGHEQFTAVYRGSIAKLEQKLRDKSATGKQRQEIEALLTEIKSDLARADAGFAHAIGHPLCQCDFPGTPMLWREAEAAHVCPKCTHRRKGAEGPVKVSPNRHDRAQARRASGLDFNLFTGE